MGKRGPHPAATTAVLDAEMPFLQAIAVGATQGAHHVYFRVRSMDNGICKYITEPIKDVGVFQQALSLACGVASFLVTSIILLLGLLHSFLLFSLLSAC